MNVRSDAGWIFATVDISDNTTTVTTNAAIVRQVGVTTVLSAHAVPIYDGSGGTNIATLPASAAVGTVVQCGDVRCPNGIFVDPNDAGTGDICIVYRDDHEGLVGSGAGLP